MRELQTTSGTNLPSKPLTAPPIAGIAHNILLTLTDPMIKDVSDAELFLYCKKAVTRAYSDTGYKISGETEQQQENELQYQIESILIDLRTYYPTLRVSEIEIAITRGVRKEYGEYYGLTPVAFSDFLKGYTSDSARTKALEAFHAPTYEPEDITEGKKDIIAKECVIEAYGEFVKHGFFEDYGNAVGNALKRLGLFTYTDAEISALLLRAESTLRAKLAAEVQKSREKLKKEEILYRLELLNSKNDSSHVMLRKEAAKVAVIDKFREWLSAGKDINEILN